MKYLYMALATCWVFGIGLNATYKIPTSKVSAVSKITKISMNLCLDAFTFVTITFVIFILKKYSSTKAIVRTWTEI